MSIGKVVSTVDQLRFGRIYVTYSCDPEHPFKFAKIVFETDDEQIGLKMFYEDFDEMPTVYDESTMQKPGYIIIPRKMFMAWGPPNFPIEFADDDVTAEELTQKYV